MNFVRPQDTRVLPRNRLHFYILTTSDQREKLRENPVYCCIPKNKILRNTPTRETRDPCSENSEMLMQAIKDDTYRWRLAMLLDWKIPHDHNCYPTQAHPQTQCNPYPRTKDIFHRTWTKYCTVGSVAQKPQKSQRHPAKEKWSCNSQAPWTQTIP